MDDIIGFVPTDINREIKRVFYYDETNNIGKLWLKPYTDGKIGFNADIDNNFVIAGVSVNQGDDVFDEALIRERLAIPKQAKEIKFKNHFNDGDILNTISRKRTLNFLRLICEFDCRIHVTSVNNFYFGIVDIVDDLIDISDLNQECVRCGLPLEMAYSELKELLYIALHLNIKSTEALFVKYNYPNIHDNEQSDFFSELKILLLKSKGSLFSNLITNARWLYDYLVCVIDSGKKKELTFLQNNEEGVLIKHYADWYLHQAMLFPKSVHIFDKTHQISNILKDIEIYIDSEHLTPIDNYEFKDSKDDIGIQLSDVICGIYGQLYSYFNKKTDADILRDIDRMNDTQLECLSLLSRLQLEADNENRGYFYYTVPYSFLGRVTSCFQYIEGILHTT